MASKVPTNEERASVRVSWLVVLGLIVIVTRLPLLSRFESIGPKTYDEIDYNRLAVNLVESGDYGFAPGNLTSLRPPFYSATLSLVYRVFGTENFLAVRIFQIMANIAIAVVVYLIAKLVYDDENVARLASAFVAFYPSLWLHNYLILTETWFTLWLCLSTYFLVRFLREPSTRWVLFSGVCVGISSLTRTVMWPSPPLLILVLLCARSVTLRQRIMGAVIFFLAFAVTISPWVVRNTIVQKRLTLIDTNGGLIFLWNISKSVGLKPDKQSESTDGTIRDAAEDADREGKRESRAMRNALQLAAANPLNVLRRTLRNFVLFWGPEQEILGGARMGHYGPLQTWQVILSGVVANLFYLITIFAAIIALFVSPPARLACGAIVLAFILHICAVHSVVYGHSRYHLPGMALLFIFSASAFVHFKEIFRPEKRMRALAAGGCCLALASSWVAALWGTGDFQKLIELFG